MAKAQANGIEIEFDTFGNQANPALLLIMGLGVQMIAWPEAACRQLAEFGLFVIRFDNRDCGLSTKFDSFGLPNIFAGMAGDTSSAAYTLADMAKDAIGLLDYLNIDAAHVVGISMGGMIAQQAVIDNPTRFLSLCSIISTTGAKDVGQPSPAAINALIQPLGHDREASISRGLEIAKVISSVKYFNEAQERDLITRSYDRNYCPAGVARQLMAILISPDRSESLRKLNIPTVVIHGLDDKLVDPSGGYATASAIPNAKLITFDDMAHEIPEILWDDIREAILANIRSASTVS
ncbi:MAG: alpha/beta hydrolase [Acidimicrobiaceae bacterium]|nr:alpha/beta hydrolase [Acidimicrobiaceae bacterium]